MSRFEDLYLMTQSAVLACPLCPQTYEYRDPVDPRTLEADLHHHVSSEHTIDEALSTIMKLKRKLANLTALPQDIVHEPVAPTYVIDPGPRVPPFTTRLGILVQRHSEYRASVQWTFDDTSPEHENPTSLYYADLDVDFEEGLVPGYMVIRRSQLTTPPVNVEIGAVIGHPTPEVGSTAEVSIRWDRNRPEREEHVNDLAVLRPLWKE